MRSLQHGLGKRSPLFVNFNAGVSFNPSAYTALDFNKTSVTAPITLTSSAAAPIGTSPAAFFTSSGDDPNTAYSFYSSLNKPWTPGSANSASAKLAWGALGADGNFDFSGKTNPYLEANKQNIETEKRTAELNAKQQEANANNIQSLLAMFAQLIQMGTKAFSGSGTA
jgi:hypothetical protein